MKDSARFWLEPDLSGLACLRATYVSHRFAPHAHEQFAIGVIESGAQRVRIRGGHEIMPANALCVINPGELHTGHAATGVGWTYSMIYPEPGVLEEAARRMATRGRGVPYFSGLVFHDPALVAGFLAFHGALASGQATRLAKESLFMGVLAAMLARFAGARPEPSPGRKARPEVLRARDYLHEHFADPLSLEALAEVAAMSPFHFLRSFRAVMGMPPHAYQIHRRIEAARKLLAGGEPPARVAAATGFVDQSHLTNRFKAALGVTPGHYLKMSRNLQDRPAPRGA